MPLCAGGVGRWPRRSYALWGLGTQRPSEAAELPRASGTSDPCSFTEILLRHLDALTTTGFTLTQLSEPQPLPEVRDRDPRAWTLLTTQPRFLFLAARRD